MIMGLKGNNNPKLSQYMLNIRDNLEINEFIKNPYRGSVRKYSEGNNKIVYLIRMYSIYPNFPLYIGAFLLLTCLIFPSKPLLIISLFVTSLAILWTSLFYQFMLWIGLKKLDLSKDVKFMKSEEIEAYLWDN